MGSPWNGFAAILPLYLAIVPLYAHRQRRLAAEASRDDATTQGLRFTPDIDVIVTCYNEQPALLGECLQSLRAQDYRGRARVWVVDDGSDNRDELLPVLGQEAHPTWQVLLLNKNYGKRVAQATAFREGRGTVIICVDSDTVVAPDGIRRIVTPFRDKAVGAVSGNLRAVNRGHSWLTRAIDVRYYLLCERERAAQSRYGAVLCCAGPFSAYRRSAVKRVLRRYLGRRRSGDDLELTNLVLKEGYRSEYRASAKAQTYVPTTILGFARQQRRWNRSFYRELPRILRLISGRGLYMTLDTVAKTVVPPMVAGALLITTADVLLAPWRLPLDVAAIALMALAGLELLPPLRSVPARSFALPYGLIFVLLLLPIRLWAACTFLRDQWGTRELPNRSLLDSAQQLTRVRLADLVPLLPVEIDSVPKGASGFPAAAVQQQHLSQVEARLGS